MTPSINPLKQEHLQAIDATLAHQQAVSDYIDKVAALGIDVSAARAQWDGICEFCHKTKRTFFPHAP